MGLAWLKQRGETGQHSGERRPVTFRENGALGDGPVLVGVDGGVSGVGDWLTIVVGGGGWASNWPRQ